MTLAIRKIWELLEQHGAKSEKMVQFQKMLLVIVPGLCGYQCRVGGGPPLAVSQLCTGLEGPSSSCLPPPHCPPHSTFLLSLRSHVSSSKATLSHTPTPKHSETSVFSELSGIYRLILFWDISCLLVNQTVGSIREEQFKSSSAPAS